MARCLVLKIGWHIIKSYPTVKSRMVASWRLTNANHQQNSSHMSKPAQAPGYNVSTNHKYV